MLQAASLISRANRTRWNVPQTIQRIAQPLDLSSVSRTRHSVLRGLGHRLNKQKNHSFHESGMDVFSHLYIQMHCLPLVSGILDTTGYPDFHVIPTFQEMSTTSTVLDRKVGITFCSLRGNEPAALQKSV